MRECSGLCVSASVLWPCGIRGRCCLLYVCLCLYRWIIYDLEVQGLLLGFKCQASKVFLSIDLKGLFSIGKCFCVKLQIVEWSQFRKRKANRKRSAIFYDEHPLDYNIENALRFYI